MNMTRWERFILSASVACKVMAGVLAVFAFSATPLAQSTHLIACATLVFLCGAELGRS
jgi:hypothetical protein